MERKKVIGLIGHSHMGIVSSVGWASLGYQVISVDEDEALAQKLQVGTFPISEPGLQELYDLHKQSLLYTGNFSSLADCDLVLLVRDTPTRDDNTGDVETLLRLVDRALPHLKQGAIFVSMSQVPVGFSRKLEEKIRMKRPELGMRFLMWVETFVFGDAVQRFLKPERIILGVPDSQNKALPQLFQNAVEEFHCPILVMGFESAELTKAAINLYLASSVTFANTLADLCETTGAHIDEVVPALKLDRRIGQYAYLRPGLGIAGGNIERDLVMLEKLSNSDENTSFVRTIIAYNSARHAWLMKVLERELFEKAVTKPRIALWGLAYKKNTTSLKNSPAIRVLETLRDRGEFRAYDPKVIVDSSDPRLHGIQVFHDRYEALQGADCLLVMTDWDEFASADVEVIVKSMKGDLIVDTASILQEPMRRYGKSRIRYCSIGNVLVG